MKPVFVSASVPDPKRDRKYFATADNAAIRDAITALVQVVTPERRLIFGGHPAITPMVARVAAAQGTLDQVGIYQSQWFAPFFPREIAAFRTLIPIPAVADEASSLAEMRRRMIHDEKFSAAFFIGGMEGVVKEFEEVRKLENSPPCFPVATTGGAALLLATEHRSELLRSGAEALFNGFDYFAIFRRIVRSLESSPEQGGGTASV